MEVEAFHVNQVPVVKLAGVSKGRTNTNFQFHTKVSDRDRSIYKYIFNFGDGTPPYELVYLNKPAVKELNITHTHTYAKPGIYEVTLTAFDHDFEGSDATMTVTVTDVPKPAFAAGKTIVHGVVGEVMKFEGRESSGPDEKGVSYYWDFDDGTLGSGRNVSHKFAAPGTYMVIVTIEDTDGQRMRYMVRAEITAAASAGKQE
jgi:PKD repeat protein